jgi:hypothetical protein
MNALKLLSYLLLLSWVTSNMACTKDRLNLPEPARSIEGAYEAQNNNTPFPIQGQVIRLNIKRITADSVEVVINATVGGQLGDSLVYKRAFVGQEFIGTVYGKTCVGYRVYLNRPQEINLLTMTCKEQNVFEYTHKSFATVKFKKI